MSWIPTVLDFLIEWKVVQFVYSKSDINAETISKMAFSDMKIQTFLLVSEIVGNRKNFNIIFVDHYLDKAWFR